jgi:hypothetical protein
LILYKSIFFLIFSIYLFPFFLIKNKYIQDDITLVTALFKVKSNRHKFKSYYNWVNNLLSINRSIVFFIDKKIYSKIKKKRPNTYKNKTIWIKLDLSNFYSYKHFRKEYINTCKIGRKNYLKKNLHNFQLFIIWAEKCFFLKKSIYYNYFKSKCFYWVDAGYFRVRNMTKYINWPSISKCNKDPRVIINGIRRISNKEIVKLKNFDNKAHYYFMNHKNIGAAVFGGKRNYLLRFIYLYYKTIKLFIKKKKFIGSEQNLYTFISYLNRNIVKIINSRNYFYFRSYLS